MIIGNGIFFPFPMQVVTTRVRELWRSKSFIFKWTRIQHKYNFLMFECLNFLCCKDKLLLLKEPNDEMKNKWYRIKLKQIIFCTYAISQPASKLLGVNLCLFSNCLMWDRLCFTQIMWVDASELTCHMDEKRETLLKNPMADKAFNSACKHKIWPTLGIKTHWDSVEHNAAPRFTVKTQ